MREMLDSEVSNHYGLPNVPEDPGPGRGEDRFITRKGMDNFEGDHRDRYRVLDGIFRR